MDNLLRSCLPATSESDAEHRLQEFYSSAIEFFPQAGIFVQFSRLYELTSAGNTPGMDAAAQHSLLRSIAHEGDIILPLELCVLRRRETFKQWTAALSVAASKRRAARQVELCKARLSVLDSPAVACRPIFIELSERRTKICLIGSESRVAIRQIGSFLALDDGETAILSDR